MRFELLPITRLESMPSHPYYPSVLVQCADYEELVAEGYQFIQVDMDPEAYDQGHVPSAIQWSWAEQLRNPSTGEILNKEEFEQLMGDSGLKPKTPIIVYGDNNNWFACWAFWLMTLYGHENVRVLDGGLRKWLSSGSPVSTEAPKVTPTTYSARDLDTTDRATTEDIFSTFFSPESSCLIDVRSSAEYEGRLSGPGHGKESTCAVAGHIPTAINVPWNLNCNVDGTFKCPEELRALYNSFHVYPEMQVITYCAIGERASLAWFVLKELLGYKVVMNYDRSMAHWSRIANAPLETGEAA